VPVVQYENKLHHKNVISLFAAIYPLWSASECRRMAYDENQPRHRLTLLAMQEERAVGQINLFSLDPDHRLGNLGYHVHPSFQRRGVGALLILRAAPSVEGLFQDGLVVQTTAENAGSIALARKAGFLPAPEELLGRQAHWLRAARMESGRCLYLPPNQRLRVDELAKSAFRARRLLDEERRIESR
jgi:RimJ/RimL family protein N-acetyltransferase